jgi:hypothetical protein
MEKKNPSRPPNLKGIKTRHLGPSHWLKGKQILLLPQIKLAWKVQCPDGHWTVHYPHQIQLEKKTSPPTNWEAAKNEKKSPPPPPQNIKGKKALHLECMLGPSHWLHEISLPKYLVTIFGPG